MRIDTNRTPISAYRHGRWATTVTPIDSNRDVSMGGSEDRRRKKAEKLSFGG
ncbi:MAG: hypothetical protein ACOYJK_01190 [Prevotella sp.]